MSTSFLLFACTSQKQDEECLTLKVELKDKGVSFDDLFEKIELIPLELKEDAYVKQIQDLYLIHDTLFIFDRDLKSLLLFDGLSGKHINTIQKIGEGPGEYTYVYDVIIDSLHREIKLLSPFGFINTYDYSGNFIKKDDLPIPPDSYMDFIDYNDSTYFMWVSSPSNSDIGNIVLMSKKTNQIINGFWKTRGLEDRFVVSPFWIYDDKTYFSFGITNNVYQITSGGYRLAYRWDFGEPDIDEFREKEIVPVELKDRTKKIGEIMQRMLASNSLYRYNCRYENNRYYYAQIVFKNEKSSAPHIFYHKKTGRSYYFFATTEGLSFITYAFTDDYILGELLTEHKKDLLASNLLSADDRFILDTMKDDDNPIIVKLYFKKGS